PFAFVGIDMSSGKLAYINAGGKPPLLMVAPGRLVTLDQVSLVVGVDVDYIYQTTHVDLPEAFRVVCCTDGLTEATSAAGEALGDQRLHETLLERDSFTSASDVIAAISSAWTAHMAAAQPEDDALALVVARG
ncbi:MAG: SpoIIE family protein phosphatase, partial [Planctomycetes bacterium]|nr:SpoIIE family protein phosphatase [Planctomycetota bacterium]